jgi:hypothetical protein
MDETSGTYWGGSYFLDCNLLVLEGGVERLRRTSDSSTPIGDALGTPVTGIYAEGTVVTMEAYSFFSTYPPPSTGTSTITLRRYENGEQIYTNTISYNPGGSEPATITTTFTAARNVYYLIEAFTTYTPVSATPTPSITRTPSVTPTVTPTRTASNTPTRTITPTITKTPSTSGYPYYVQYAWIQTCGGSNTCEDSVYVSITSDSPLGSGYYYSPFYASVFRIDTSLQGSYSPADYDLGTPNDVTGTQTPYCCL